MNRFSRLSFVIGMLWIAALSTSTRGQQVGEVLERDPQVVDRPEHVVGVGLVAVDLERRDDRRQRRHVPDHRQRAELRVQRQRHAPADRQVVDR